MKKTRVIDRYYMADWKKPGGIWERLDGVYTLLNEIKRAIRECEKEPGNKHRIIRVTEEVIK